MCINDSTQARTFQGCLWIGEEINTEIRIVGQKLNAVPFLRRRNAKRTRFDNEFQIGFGGVSIREAKVFHRTLHYRQAAIHARFGVVVSEKGLRCRIFVPERGGASVNKIFRNT
ncbi:hypothetical protein D3C85_1462560 [compost metagenome]